MANQDLTASFEALGFKAESTDLFDPDVLKELSTDRLKKLLLNMLDGRDKEPVSKKVLFLKDRLLPIFEELEQRNPTPDVNQQIPLVQGIWLSVWSTIPFQDILPGRIHEQSYQIFAANGLYANMARYRPGSKQPWLNWFSRWLLSYDLMILQTYAVSKQATSKASKAATDAVRGQWIIENVGIKQLLRFGPKPLNRQAAIEWFQKAVEQYETSSSGQLSVAIPKQNVSLSMAKKYQKVAEAKPQLEHLYIDSDFRLVKTIREKTQRPSYTVAIRLPEDLNS